MHQRRYLANRRHLVVGSFSLIGIMSILGIALSYSSGYPVAFFTVAGILVVIGTIGGMMIGGITPGMFVFSLFLSVLMVWVSAIFHFLGGIVAVSAYRIVCGTGFFGISCANTHWNGLYAVGF